MKKRDKVIIGVAAVIIICIIGLWGVGTTGYLTVSEVTSDPQYIGTEVQVKGIVKEGTLQVNLSETSFVLTDRSAEINVEYTGEKPVTLAGGKDVVVIGTLVSNEKIEARKIVIGCPSKYAGG
ncbi:MAG: cytochrome c maturation protein CcmE [Methanosarcinales archaeon]|nr:MAG: cytochrome c maturation protein CcmE [Methanosarcinales archaeon]